MRRRKIVPRSCKFTATEGQSWPNSAPARRPTKIQAVSERREVAYAAIRKIANQRKSVGTSAGNGSTRAPARSDAAIAIVAATTAAVSNLFFIGARRRIPSVPKGILVSPTCQWRRASKTTTREFPCSTAGANLHATRRPPILCRTNTGYSTRKATSGSMRVARRAGR